LACPKPGAAEVNGEELPEFAWRGESERPWWLVGGDAVGVWLMERDVRDPVRLIVHR
jgi:hypothetical protein